MTLNGWLQIAIYFAVLTALAAPLGRFMARTFDGERTFLTPVLGPIERGFYRVAGVDERTEQSWTGYAVAMLVFNAAGFFLLYAILRLQDVLPLNPQGMSALSPELAFNTAVSFATNTNWQNYGGESTLSYFSQMVGLTTQNFVSAATGVALLLAIIRGFARASAKTVGNFWVDMTRTTLYVLLPLSILLGLFLVWQGVPQNMAAYVDATTLEGAKQTISQGPAASQIAIKQLGTNGGGFWNANSAVPYENPTPLSNFVEMLAILLIPAALCVTFGRMVKDERQGWAIYAAMSVVFLACVAVSYWAEGSGNPLLHALGLSGGAMEGKEVRFGIANSSLWSVATTAASNGSVNAMHDSLTPLAGLMPILLMQLSEVIFGGVGSGLYGMLLYVIVAVFVAGLMVGRTPEYLGKKIEGREVKFALLGILVLPLFILGFMSIATVAPFGLSSVQDAGPHGFSEIMYLYSSSVGNNGSAFAGFTGNTPWYNITGGVSMLVGRYFMIIPVMAIAGALVAKKTAPASAGTFPTHGGLFVGLLVGVVIIVGGLTFFPALALGPIVEHLAMLAGQTF
ncbi:potassium-transporting ATPase subunit KdpA [Methylopila turkensis]|uniref:Potassium-transporting ATPase potassium-binding subunit n=1 Tax=Methylopila turkensis TaxID=1437816 RepID=A0A9W6JR41_9HYPH|nr:potassium-transporting ATPase subunit KdpA [Methylopila turkensis]GLK80078.1 potassium-transporting ATPase potassium-binding subunit [Methylopila turkensis]